MLKYAVYVPDADGKPTTRLSAPLTKDEVPLWLKNFSTTPDNDIDVSRLLVVLCDDDGNKLEGIPAEEEAKATESVQHLLKHNKAVSAALTAMVGSRQLYAVGAQELRRAVEADKSSHELVLEILLSSAKDAADKEFDIRDLHNGMTHVVMPWLTKISESMAIAAKSDTAADALEKEKDRRSRKIPIGIKYSAADTLWLPRDRGLIMVAYSPATACSVLTRVMQTAADYRDDKYVHGMTIIHLGSSNDVKPDRKNRVITVPYKAWQSAAVSNDSFDKFIHKHVAEQLPAMPDLLVVDDLLQLVADSSHTATGVKAGTALRRLNAWCRGSGCGLVGAVIDDSDSIKGYRWEGVVNYSFAVRLVEKSVAADGTTVTELQDKDGTVLCDVHFGNMPGGPIITG